MTSRFEHNWSANGRPDTLPGLVETLTQALLLGSTDTAEVARLHADLVITPPNRGVGMLEFHQLDRLREAGRKAAAEALERAPSSLPS